MKETVTGLPAESSMASSNVNCAPSSSSSVGWIASSNWRLRSSGFAGHVDHRLDGVALAGADHADVRVDVHEAEKYRVVACES